MPTQAATFDTAAIAAAMDAMLVAGAPAVLVEVRNGDEVWRNAVGVTEVTGSQRPDALAPVRIASVTKVMLGTVLLQLVSEGALDLDEPIANYLPDLRLGREVLAGADGTEAPQLEPSPPPTGPSWTAPAAPPPPSEVPTGAVVGSDVAFDVAQHPILDPTSIVTARMLAQHTAGLPDYIGTFPLADLTGLHATLEATYDTASLVERVAGLPWTGEPGAAFAYSNTNYLVLSLLIERLTGEPIDRVLQERLFEPGKLAATSLPTTADLPADGAHGYFTHEGIYIDVSRQSGTLWSGAGGVVSTVGDVNSFERALLQGAYLFPEQLRELLRLNGDGYGIGVQGRADPCPAGDPVLVPAIPDAGAAPGASVAPTGRAAGPGATPLAIVDTGEASSASPTPSASTTPSATPGARVQIGEPGMTYGHLGSGLGYRILTFSSPDGMRQVTVAWTASPLDYATDARLAPAWQLVDAALLATCPPGTNGPEPSSP